MSGLAVREIKRGLMWLTPGRVHRWSLVLAHCSPRLAVRAWLLKAALAVLWRDPGPGQSGWGPEGGAWDVLLLSSLRARKRGALSASEVSEETP